MQGFANKRKVVADSCPLRLCEPYPLTDYANHEVDSEIEILPPKSPVNYLVGTALRSPCLN